MTAQAATMDAMVKAVQAGIFPAGSEVIWDRLGVTDAEKQVLRRELASQRASKVIQGLSAAVGNVDQPALADPNAGVDSFIPGAF
ncbi:hypothetical protein HW450_12850 [Corynebacterium hindlerae]|uniref:Uncharacterized protein n=1 Tax=Corynebacterium hindlerae TaxID=699041 RepID=A0A7G5FEZ3_9CORY|nr:hypothetical protein [Corynebacterium hindlerae]QMV85184.1 hypothetical protein HW450_12850 [Corynebacterium hindlerae]